MEIKVLSPYVDIDLMNCNNFEKYGSVSSIWD